MKKISFLVTAAAALAFANDATSQCFQFANVPSGAGFPIADDAVRTVALPFSFPFNGGSTNLITICSNGFIWLGAAPVVDPADFSATEAELRTRPARIAVDWCDWDTDNFAVIPPGGGVFFNTTLTQCNIIWKGIPRFGSSTIFANMECVLTSTGGIHLYYAGTHNIPNVTNIVGFSRGTTAPASPVNWSPTLPASALDSTAYEVFTSNVGVSPFDMVGRIVNLVPNAPPNTTPPINYTPNGNPLPVCGTIFPMAVAPVASGTGCPEPNVSLYEAFTATAGARPIDLANSSVLFARTADSYTTAQGPGLDANYATSGAILPSASDDTLHNFTLASTFQFGNQAISQITLSSNGYIWLGNSALQQVNASVPTFHTSVLPRISGYWKDLVPNNSTAPIYVENTATRFMATWQNVPLFQGAGSQTFQIEMTLASGNITLSYGTLTGVVTASPPVVGIAPQAPATNQANSDLATAGVANIVGPVRVTGGGTPLTHVVVGVGAALGQTLTMNFAGAPPSNIGLATFIIGSQTLAITVDSLAGPGMAPGCFLYTDFLSEFPLATLPGSPTGSLSVPVPMDVFIAGVQLRSQVALVAPVNPLGAITSNVNQWTVGF